MHEYDELTNNKTFIFGEVIKNKKLEIYFTIGSYPITLRWWAPENHIDKYMFIIKLDPQPWTKYEDNFSIHVIHIKIGDNDMIKYNDGDEIELNIRSSENTIIYINYYKIYDGIIDIDMLRNGYVMT